MIVGSLFICIFFLKIFMPYMCGIMNKYFVNFMETLSNINALTQSSVLIMVLNAFLIFCVLAGPVAILSSLAAIIFTGIQTKFLFSKKAFAFKLENLNIINGLKNVFSLKNSVKLLVSILKVTIVGWLLCKNYLKSAESFAKLMNTDLMRSSKFIFAEIFRVIMNLGIALAGIAAIDYVYNWWTFEKNIRMSKQEVKDEYKQLEGDPQVKGYIRRKQRQLAQSRMMQMVPQADVVIRNPTHFAVALKYKVGKDFSPKVIAKGKDNIALKIIEIAENSKVPITENKLLARALYNKVKLGKNIPTEFFKAVAEILAWVYKNKKDRGNI